MWKLAILLCFTASIQAVENNPYLELASSLLQNVGEGGDGLGALGNLMGTLMQGDNAGNPGRGGGSDSTGDLLSGLGSLLGGQDGKLDPAMIGSMISMFSQMNQPKQQQRERRQASIEQDELNIDSMLNMASGLLGNKNIASLLPVLMNSINSMPNPETKHIAEGHKGHANFLPPFLERIHLYWDLFINSELGKTIWEKSGLRKALKAFTGPDGSVSFELMMKNFENLSFRRHWIKAAARYLTDMVMHMAKPEVYQRYIMSAEYIINGFLDSQGLPKSTHFNIKKPDESITVLLNFMLKKYLDVDSNVAGYVKPAVDYIKQTLKMAQSASASYAARGDHNALADRLTDTLNLEIIEPVLRVHRAYQHSLKAPHCQEHLMCLVNRHDGSKGLPGFKAGLTKLSSLAASAALSFQNGKGFWDLYNAIQSDANCEAKYPADCTAFHDHELKVTTEVYHSEL